MDFFELQLISNLFISLFTLSNADWSPFTYLWVSLLICGLLYIVVFALEGVALYTIAKREGYKQSVELSKKYGLYRQEYCGCEFSLTDNEKTQ